MSFYSCNRYRLIVMFLLILIMWQIYRLLPDDNPSLPVVPVKKLTEHDLEVLEDDKYNKHKIDKIKLRVYYESLCPDSRWFFSRHLEPVTEKLSDFLDVTLIPYGKAETKTSEDGSYTFTCQHGERECLGNKIHACSIEALENQTRIVQFTTCMIKNNVDPDAALERCAEEMKVHQEPISECAKGPHGSELLKKYGDDTKIVNPGFIPLITLNGSKDNQAAIQKNFLLEICKLINIPLPPPCL